MFGILVSAFNTALGFLVRKLVVKAIVFGCFFFIVHEFLAWLVAKVVPNYGNSLTDGFVNITPEIWYFLDLMAVPFGIPLLLSAYVSRFVVRRIPVIG